MRDADPERPLGCERSDAAEQVVVALQRHEGGARRGDRAGQVIGCGQPALAGPQRLADGCDRDTGEWLQAPVT